MKPIAIVPARGGSRRIPGKNKRPLAGVPLIVRAIQVLISSGGFETIFVSTDDAEIAELAMANGAIVPRLRHAELSDDFTPVLPVVRDAIQQFEALRGEEVGIVCVAYPAAALVFPNEVQQGLALLEGSTVDAVFTAGEFPHPIQRAWIKGVNGLAHMANPQAALMRSQDLEQHYFDTGQLYFGRRVYWLDRASLGQVNRRMLLRPSWAAIDIDTEEDWERAEIAIRILDTSRRVEFPDS